MQALRPRAPDRDAAQRVKSWAADRFGSVEEAWFVTETQCIRTPDAVPAPRTVLGLLHPAASIAFRIEKALGAIEREDIETLGAREAALAAEACC
jgi:hypothetical protein